MTIKESVTMIIVDILTTVYQSFWFALFLSTFFMFLYLYAYYPEDTGKGIKTAFCAWYKCFRRDSFFRKLFFLAFYIAMVLFRTLLSRSLWPDPLSNIMGGWQIWNIGADGNRIPTSECFENLMLMLPFTMLLLWTMGEKITGENAGLLRTIRTSLKAAFLFSLTIESLQLFLRLGTFQLSDIVYNTLGGGIGGGMIFVVYIRRSN